MATRGRKPKPPEVKALEGERPDRMPPAPPTPEDGVGDPPEVLDDEGRRQWHRLAPQLTRAGVLKSTDADALALYCDHYSRWVEANKQIKKEGLLTVGGQGALKMNPAVSIARESMAAMARLLSEFGATPSSRSRVSVAAEGPRDDLADFLGG